MFVTDAAPGNFNINFPQISSVAFTSLTIYPTHRFLLIAI